MKPYVLAPVLLVLLAACGGSSGGGAPGAPAGYVPLSLTPPVVESMLSSNEDASQPRISGDGLCVTFMDGSANAIPGDTNEQPDVLFHELSSGSSIHASRGMGGLPGDGESQTPALDTDGSHVAFVSTATNLVPGDTNEAQDIYVYVPATGATTRVSVDGLGNQAEGGSSHDPAISGDGSVVAFSSDATNLVPGDTNGARDIFVHDTSTGITSRVSVKTGGSQATGNSRASDISADGNLIVFDSEAEDLDDSDANGQSDVFLHDRSQGTTIRLTRGTRGEGTDGGSYTPRISADGSVVVFTSYATNLISDDNNGTADVFAYEVGTGAITRVSVGPGPVEATGGQSRMPDVSADGRYVAFMSFATNLVPGDTNNMADIFRHDRSNGTNIQVNVTDTGARATTGGGAFACAISDDGMRVVFAQGTCEFAPDGLCVHGNENVFLKDLSSGALDLMSQAVDRSLLDGPVGNSALSANGRWLVFESSATNLIPGDTNNRMDLFMRDMTTGLITRVFEKPDDGEGGSIYWELGVSNDGRYVSFESYDPALLPPGVDTNNTFDVYVVDTTTGTIERISVHTDGTEGNNPSYAPVMSADGAYVIFVTRATTLVDGDTNSNYELMLRDVEAGTTARAVFDKDGLPIEEGILEADISDDGRYISFETIASDLMATPDTNNVDDVYRYDRNTGTNIRVSLDWTGAQVNDEEASHHRMSGNGMVFLWRSFSSTTVENDTNGGHDLFVRDLGQGTTTRVNVDSNGNQSASATGRPRAIGLSTDGDVVVFASFEKDLAEGLEDFLPRIFAHQRSSGTTIVAGRAPDGGLPYISTDAHRHCLGPDGSTLVYRTWHRAVSQLYQIDLSQIVD